MPDVRVRASHRDEMVHKGTRHRTAKKTTTRGVVLNRDQAAQSARVGRVDWPLGSPHRDSDIEYKEPQSERRVHQACDVMFKLESQRVRPGNTHQDPQSQDNLG
eukprot:304131-Rhodomonas_salina.3